MPEPATKLDNRFSEPGSAATAWIDTRRVLEGAQLFWITTVRANGHLHVSPVVAVWLNDTLYVSTGPAEQKALNLRANPHVALTTGCNSWEHGLDVVVEGPAVQVTDDSLLARMASGHCCVGGARGARQSRRLFGAGLDGGGEFVERRRDPKMTVSSLGAEFIVPPTQVLQERMAPNDHPGGPVGLQTTDRPQPRLASAVVALDPVVRILLSMVERSGEQLGDDVP
jgi:hypothetical protein